MEIDFWLFFVVRLCGHEYVARLTVGSFVGAMRAGKASQIVSWQFIEVVAGGKTLWKLNVFVGP